MIRPRQQSPGLGRSFETGVDALQRLTSRIKSAGHERREGLNSRFAVIVEEAFLGHTLSWLAFFPSSLWFLLRVSTNQPSSSDDSP
jgi:hypothetical protein